MLKKSRYLDVNHPLFKLNNATLLNGGYPIFLFWQHKQREGNKRIGILVVISIEIGRITWWGMIWQKDHINSFHISDMLTRMGLLRKASYVLFYTF
jgi:hypothetical protein